jgi:hypothetical protein
MIEARIEHRPVLVILGKKIGLILEVHHSGSRRRSRVLPNETPPQNEAQPSQSDPSSGSLSDRRGYP